jgi:translocation protein SEC62
MADRRKNANATEASSSKSAMMNPKEPMDKFHRAVTDWLKRNVPTKKTKFLHSHVVDYFIGRKAVDLLVEESPWAPVKQNTNSDDKSAAATAAAPSLPAGHRVLATREEATELLDMMLRYKMFHRAKKIPVTEEDKKARVGGRRRVSAKERTTDSEPEREGREETPPADSRKESRVEDSSSAENSNNAAASATAASNNDDNNNNDAQKKKRKIRLDMHLDQVFLDTSDAYVWLYDPIPWYYWLAGGAIVAVLIAVCLFPLWPRRLRHGAHWLAFAAACFMVGVLALAVVKYALFALLYGLSGGKLKFWLMPNLTEDVGFIRSFWPLYAYKYTGQVVRDYDEDDDQLVVADGKAGGASGGADESDSNESQRSAFELIEKSKDD